LACSIQAPPRGTALDDLPETLDEALWRTRDRAQRREKVHQAQLVHERGIVGRGRGARVMSRVVATLELGDLRFHVLGQPLALHVEAVDVVGGAREDRLHRRDPLGLARRGNEVAHQPDLEILEAPSSGLAAPPDIRESDLAHRWLETIREHDAVSDPTGELLRARPLRSDPYGRGRRVPVDAEAAAAPLGLAPRTEILHRPDIGLELVDARRPRADIAQRRVAAADSVAETPAGELL
jgi:hypothetical protein